MIIRLDDILDEMYKKYPDLTEKSVERICIKSLRNINKVLRNGDELVIPNGIKEQMKFFIPMSPEQHDEWSKHRHFKNLNKKNIKQAEDG